MAAISRREHRSTVIWPGFVDALATLLMVIIFLLLIFVMAQFFLGQALSGRDKALKELENDLSALSSVLALTKSENAQLQTKVDSLQNQLSASLDNRANIEQQLAALRIDYASATDELSEFKARSVADKEEIDRQLFEIADLSGDVAALKALKDVLEKEVSTLSFRAQAAEDATKQLEQSLSETTTSLAKTSSERDDLKVGLAEKQEIADTVRAQLALMNKQMAALRQQLNQLNVALEASELDAKEKNVQIELLGQRLNAALASKVQELSRYRSEFFGRLRHLIGNRDDVQIVGDRFVLQSELLFAKGSADIAAGGERELGKLATTLLEIALKMPGDIDWILRVDGHTDNDPIATLKFPSNWELSTARALSVVHTLIKAGIPAKRLAATGFGEHYPLTSGSNEIAKAKNRRIELKFTQR
jgi:chemotaxis protein MotB